jgi:anti-sigma regulatory factor (Ser/Thr protein kinase)
LTSRLCQNEFLFELADDFEAGFSMLMAEREYLVLIVDINSPGLNPEEMRNRLRKEHLFIPMILLGEAAAGHESLPDHCHDETQWFSKPVKIDRLMTYLRRRALIDDLGVRFFPGIPNLLSWVFEMEYRTDEINPTHVSNFIANMLFLAKYCEEKAMTRIEIAVHEAIVNAMDHGNLSLDSSLKPETFEDEDDYYALRCARIQSMEYGGKMIRIRLAATGKSCEITITDQGKGFDHKKLMGELRAQTDREKLLEAHGRGLILIMYSVDQVAFNEPGNSITLTIMTDQDH